MPLPQPARPCLPQSACAGPPPAASWIPRVPDIAPPCASVFRARVVDVAPESLIIEITGDEDKIDGLLEVLRPYGVLEMVRTGIVAMRRGNKCSSVAAAPKALAHAAGEDDVQYSV